MITSTSSQDEISSWDETCTRMKKIMFAGEFRPTVKYVEFHPWMKLSLKENL